MRDFDHIPERIDAALRSARVLLVLYTPSLPSSEYCRQEMHFALLRSHYLHRRRGRVLAVVQGVDIADVRPGRLKLWRLPRPDTDPAAIATQIARHVNQLRRDDPRRLGGAPDPPPVSWHPGPQRDPLKAAASMHTAFQAAEDLYQHVRPIVARRRAEGAVGNDLIAHLLRAENLLA